MNGILFVLIGGAVGFIVSITISALWDSWKDAERVAEIRHRSEVRDLARQVFREEWRMQSLLLEHEIRQAIDKKFKEKEDP